MLPLCINATSFSMNENGLAEILSSRSGSQQQ